MTELNVLYFLFSETTPSSLGRGHGAGAGASQSIRKQVHVLIPWWRRADVSGLMHRMGISSLIQWLIHR